MKYNFDKLIPRHGTASMKWDYFGDGEDVLPLWVADMDFEAAPCIIEALRRRVEHGVFGYNIVPDSYFAAVQDWFRRHHAFDIDKEWIMPVPGVVAGISCVIKALTKPGDAVLFHVPAYNLFFSSAKNNGCRAELAPLTPTGESFVIDFDDFETRCAKPDVKLFLLCNPHNPSGRVWTREELRRTAEICSRHDVVVVSDEIHCEIVMPGYTYVPFATVSGATGRNITLSSPTKGFNIAGLQIANIVCDNAEWRKKIDRAVNDNEVCDLNPFGIAALQAAYNEGGEWLDEMCKYVYGNYLALKDFLEKEAPELRVCRLEGTYLVWIDTSRLPVSAAELSDRILREGKVRVNDGRMYGDPADEQHLRINIACPRARLMEALHRIAAVVRQL